MSESAQQEKLELRVSHMAENLIGSEIIKLGGEIRERIQQGEHIYNFTIGDFNPKIFPIPAELKQAIVDCYGEDLTNYPAADGVIELRKPIVELLKKKQGLSYATNEILVAGGARPIIYAIYQALVDPGDKVVFPVPSWNNNHYTHLSHAEQVFVETTPEDNFMPNADLLREHLQGATLLALCSPLNPTGTVFTKEQLEGICDLVLEENARRGTDEKPLYVMYDQIYSLLTFGDTQHVDPVSLRPEMRNYTVFVDGISKSLASTGVRVGWGFGPAFIIDKMKSILGHVGAWAPRPEQVAAGRYLSNHEQVDSYLTWIKSELENRLHGFYNGFESLRKKGYDVRAIPPAAAIYLTVQFNLVGKKTADGNTLEHTGDITSYILNEAKVALVPFRAFGASDESTWYRLSVGTASMQDVEDTIASLENALAKLS